MQETLILGMCLKMLSRRTEPSDISFGKIIWQHLELRSPKWNVYTWTEMGREKKISWGWLIFTSYLSFQMCYFVMCTMFQDRTRRQVINVYVFLKPDTKNTTIASTNYSPIFVLVEIRDRWCRAWLGKA